ncbi:MAG: hypothetical protein RR326_11955, partial [Stenotrophomonas sp.]
MSRVKHKPMKMKLLDCTLISLLASGTPWAMAQDSTVADATDGIAKTVDCDAQGCSDEGELLV